MENCIKRKIARQSRHRTIRRKLLRISGGFPRLCVNRSLKHITAQIVDDNQHRSLLQITSRVIKEKMRKTEISRQVGKMLAEKALALGIQRVVFDRGGYLYHGRVKALAEAAREHGLKF